MSLSHIGATSRYTRSIDMKNICDDCDWVISEYHYTYDDRGFIVGEDVAESLYAYAWDDKNDLLVAMAYDGDGNRIFQLNYNLHTDDDWKGNSGNGNGNNKDNSGSGNNGNSSGNGTGSKGLVGSFLGLFTGDSEEAGDSADTSTTSNASPESKGNKGNKDKDKGNDGNDKNNGKGNGNGNSGNNGNGNSGNNGNGNSGNNGNASTGGSNDNNGNANGNTNNTGGSQNQSGILFPIDGEVSELESELIGMIKTTGKEKNYELVEYVNDVNREHTEVLMELNINGIMDTAYSYGNERLTNERFTGWTGYYTYDPRGSVTGVTDDTGMIWQSYRYNANGDMTFGKPQYNNVYSYNAESYNPNMESQYLRARYYNVPNGNFMTEDSYLGNITDPLTLNRYNYVKSSPLNYIDPSGHETWEETLERYMRDTPIESQQLSGSEIEALGTLYHDDWAARYSNATSDRERWGLVFEAKTVLRTNKILSEAYRTVSDLLEQGMTAAEISSYLQECGQENEILKALSNVNWAKVGTGLLQTVRAAIVISVGIAAIAASGPTACAAIIGLLNGAGISALGLNAIGVTLAGSMVATMGYADATQAYGNIYYGLLGSDDEVAHIIIDNIEFLRNDPELYYLFEAMATLGTAEATKMFEINYGIYLSNRESNILEKASYKNKGESEAWKRNLKNTGELNGSNFENLKDNGTVKVNQAGSDRPLKSDPNSFLRTENGEHVFVYDDNGDLIYDISSSRVKGFKVNVNPAGEKFFSPYKLEGSVPQFILDLFGW